MPTAYIIEGNDQARMVWSLERRQGNDVMEALELLESATEVSFDTLMEMEAVRHGLDIGFGTEGYAWLEPQDRTAMLTGLRARLSGM